MAAPPTLPPMETADSFDPDFNVDSSASHINNHHEESPTSPADLVEHTTAATLPGAKHEETDGQSQQQVQDILHSDIGISTLLSRLKASISSAKDFAGCLKRRGATEEEHANSLKKLSRMTLESIRKPDGRHESYLAQFEQVMHANERIADNGTQFGLALHAMHENLLQLATKMETSRRTWKQQGLAAESKVQDAERLAEKAKSKYDQLADDLDRVKTGDSGAGRKFGLKGPKSAAQHEEDLQRKVQAADQDYASKVQTAQIYRKELVSTTRPQAVTALVDLIREIDAALTMEMQKYASFNEKLVVNNGQVVSPQPLKGSTAAPASSINQLIYQINNDKDFDDYVLAQAIRVPTNRSNVVYQKHPTLMASHAHPTPPNLGTSDRRASIQAVNQPPPSFGIKSNEAPQSSIQSQTYNSAEPAQQPSFNSYQTGYTPLQHQQQSSHPGVGDRDSGSAAPGAHHQSGYAAVPSGPPPGQQSSGVLYNNSAPPVNPIFGVSLDELFNRDGSPVPLVVYQCIQAVDLYGLEVEGIYRISGTASHIQTLKAMFDRDASQVDFRNPEAFQQDVNSVAGLLKQYFRELPDPVLTKDFYQKFIDAARIDDDTMRRDSMHALINALPDPNYATLRALMLHLYRVEQSSSVNRMSAANLGICWAPSVMGPHTGNNMADAGLQAKVVITIMENVLQIFDED